MATLCGLPLPPWHTLSTWAECPGFAQQKGPAEWGCTGCLQSWSGVRPPGFISCSLRLRLKKKGYKALRDRKLGGMGACSLRQNTLRHREDMIIAKSRTLGQGRASGAELPLSRQVSYCEPTLLWEAGEKARLGIRQRGWQPSYATERGVTQPLCTLVSASVNGDKIVSKS